MKHDLIIVGAGAAGLAAAIFAGEAARDSGLRILLVDGARKPGAKILVSGGGRCNVTNVGVTPEDFWGGPRTIIRNVLRSFDEKRTLAWMEELGVELKLEETGKYFPASDSARTVLDALSARVEELGVEARSATKIASIKGADDGFLLEIAGGETLLARRVIIATGGMALPKSGSDGAGITMLRELGHSIIPMTPALVPLTVSGEELKFCADLSGLTFDARITLRDAKGRTTYERVDSLLFTHFGISGPAALNVSRHLLRNEIEHPDSPPILFIGAPKFQNSDEANAWLLKRASESPKRLTANVIYEVLPDRFASAISGTFGEIGRLTREARLELARVITGFPIRITGNRGYSFAETTAGGVDLREIDYRTMLSRKVPNLFLCGELLDVDGRIGGFNFQWAWATGYLAGRGAIRSLTQEV